VQSSLEDRIAIAKPCHHALVLALAHCPNIAMDYNFYGASQQQQAYQYMGMPTNAYATTGIDLDAMRSVVSASASVLQRLRLHCTTMNSPI
jgi:hypothetical protein